MSVDVGLCNQQITAKMSDTVSTIIRPVLADCCLSGCRCQSMCVPQWCWHPRGPPWVSPEGSMNRAPIAEDQGRSFALSAYKLHQIHCKDTSIPKCIVQPHQSDCCTLVATGLLVQLLQLCEQALWLLITWHCTLQCILRQSS